MLPHSQPLDAETSKLFESSDTRRSPKDEVIKAQYIGGMFDDIFNNKRKPSLKTRLRWKWQHIGDVYYNIKWVIRNHINWDKTMYRLRSWEAPDGLLSVMITHLQDYIETEEKYGHSAKECREHKIATAKETVQLLRRMRDPDGYRSRRVEAVEKRYPEYKYLVSRYESGSTCYSGDFVAQGDGWVGKESGADPREGYFEFVDGRFELAESPDKNETDRLLAELNQYHEEIHKAYEQAEIDSDEDFAQLHRLLKENLYSWWD
jgi:hypothetical protein